MRKCISCGQEYKSYKKERKFCSKKCAQNYKSINNSFLQKCVFCKKEYKIIKSKKNLSSYCSLKCKGEDQKIILLGNNNPNFNNHKLLGVKRTDTDINKIIAGATKYWKTIERKNKHKKWLEVFKEENGFYPFHSDDARKKSYKSRAISISEGRVNNVTHGICGYYNSLKTNIKEWYQSSYELIRMQELDLDDNVKTWTKKHKISIKLTDHTWYIPDFFIELTNDKKILEEVKGYVRNKELFDKQVELTNLYCKENNINYVVNYMNHLRNGKNKN